MSEADYAGLVTAAHTQLAAPVILIWDNLNTHISQRMRAWIDAHADWLTVEQLPAYAPELNAAGPPGARHPPGLQAIPPWRPAGEAAARSAWPAQGLPARR